MDVERPTLQAERPIELRLLAPILEKLVLALDEPEHRAAEEPSGLAVLAEQDRIMHQQV